MTTDSRHVGQENLCAAGVAPAIMPHVVGRATDDVDDDVGLWNQGLDQRTLAGADLAEETQVHRVVPGGKLLELRLRLADVHTGSLSLPQP